MKFFGGSKKPASKKHASSPSVDESEDHIQEHPHVLSEPSSPTKKPAPSKSPPPKKPSRPLSYRDLKSSTTPKSRLARQSTDPTSSRRSSKFDPDTHPLNLPPEERKRLSALSTSAMSGRNSMDIDREPVNGASSPPPPAASQKSSAQRNFSVPIPNGISHDQAPPPPPHKSNPSSPTPTPQDDAEAYKGAGNRFFKEKNYPKAIEQYSKGMRLVLEMAHFLRRSC